MNNTRPLIALKTTLELRADDEVVNVYVIKVARKVANKTLKVLKSINESATSELQHLRRFARSDEIPDHLLSTFSSFSSSPTATESTSDPTLADLYLLVSPVTSINIRELEDILCKILPLPSPVVQAVSVPLFAPTSSEQARSWSSSHWPTVYKKSNPFGPHPSIVSRAEDEVNKDLHNWMGMAIRAALGSKSMGYGEAVGAVIVWRDSQTSRAIALAGDGRWKSYGRDGIGNPMAHAVMRVIGMVAQKLKALDDDEYSSGQIEHPQACHTWEQDIFLHGPIMPEEQAVYESSQVPPNDYLCHGLELYITHEPCVACSMAVLHSRFARVVFGHRMPRTGGLCSELCSVDKVGHNHRSLGHGLFWRKELNWSLLAWQTNIEEVVGLHLDPIIHV